MIRQRGDEPRSEQAVKASQPASTAAAKDTNAVETVEPTKPVAPIGWVDEPRGDTIVGSALSVSGWAVDGAGIKSVQIRIGGKAFDAQFGLPRPDVAAARSGYPDSAAPGFRFSGDIASVLRANQRQIAQIVAVSKAGTETVLATRHVVPPADAAEWRSLYLAQRASPDDLFYVVPGLSAVKLGGAADIENAYTGYVSPTLRVGMRVPILYMRTTLGAAKDFRFDPDWDIERRCGERRIAEDALSAVIAHARKHRIPILFTLNGGVWSDATCNVPEWDVTDHLERDPRNVQWNERDQAEADDALKHLPGAQESPELARMLTYNVFAAQNRRYKRRNLQAAGRIVAEFARTDPELFVGVTLDPDTVQNPFFGERQWYDYNRDTVRQFRHWLAGTGPYRGQGGPDLRRYRRSHPLTLADVNKLSGQRFARWDDVDPPRKFPREGRPFWEDPWTHEWEVFRRHLIDLHYDDLSRWLAEAGVSSRRIFSGQGFMAPHHAAMPFALRVDSPSKNYDSGGVSVEGAVPSAGHLGAVIYGPAARNDIPMETPDSLFAAFKRLDPDWGIVEFNTADLRQPKVLPTYVEAYRAYRDAFNFGARLMSPMAWGGSDGLYAGQPGYVSYMAWRNTPLEEALRDFAISHSHVPRGTRLWTFGSPVLASDDGWSVAAGGALRAGHGMLELQPSGGEITLLSPPNLVLRAGEVGLLVLGSDRPADIVSVRLELRDASGTWLPAGEANRAALKEDPAGLLMPIAWPKALAGCEQVRIVLDLADAKPLTLRHIALYRAAPLHATLSPAPRGRAKGRRGLGNRAYAVASGQEARIRKARQRVRRDVEVRRKAERSLRNQPTDDRRELETVAGKAVRDVEAVDARQRSQHRIPVGGDVVDAGPR